MALDGPTCSPAHGPVGVECHPLSHRSAMSAPRGSCWHRHSTLHCPCVQMNAMALMFLVQIAPRAGESGGRSLFTRHQSVVLTPNTRGSLSHALLWLLFSVQLLRESRKCFDKLWWAVGLCPALIFPSLHPQSGEVVSGYCLCLQARSQLSATRSVLEVKLWPGQGKSYCKFFLLFCWAALGRSSNSRQCLKD